MSCLLSRLNDQALGTLSAMRYGPVQRIGFLVPPIVVCRRQFASRGAADRAHRVADFVGTIKIARITTSKKQQTGSGLPKRRNNCINASLTPQFHHRSTGHERRIRPQSSPGQLGRRLCGADRKQLVSMNATGYRYGIAKGGQFDDFVRGTTNEITPVGLLYVCHGRRRGITGRGSTGAYVFSAAGTMH